MTAIEKFQNLLAPIMVAREAHRQNERDDLKAEIDRFLRWLAEQEVFDKAPSPDPSHATGQDRAIAGQSEKVKDEDEYECDD